MERVEKCFIEEHINKTEDEMETIERILEAENAEIKIDPAKKKEELSFRERHKVFAALEHHIDKEICLKLLEHGRSFSELQKDFPELKEITLDFSLHKVLIPAGLVEKISNYPDIYRLTKLGKEIIEEIKAGKDSMDILLF